MSEIPTVAGQLQVNELLVALTESNRLLAQSASVISELLAVLDQIDANLCATRTKGFILLKQDLATIPLEQISVLGRHLRLRAALIDDLIGLLRQLGIRQSWLQDPCLTDAHLVRRVGNR